MIRKIRNQIRKNRGFTLVELMIVVAIVGILAALAIYGVRKYMANAKTAEARNGLGQMAKDAITAYFKEGMNPAVMEFTKSTEVNNKLCDGSGVNAVPADADLVKIKGAKYQSSPSEWATWDCLHWSMNDPQYYQYDYLTEGDNLGVKGAKFTCQARGDLDGDSTLSTFKLLGEVKTDTGGITTAIAAPNIDEKDPEE
jgi:type IV pilus assembly protein PilA